MTSLRNRIGIAHKALLLATAAPMALTMMTAPVEAQQTTSVIQGTVTNDSGAPIANATLTILHGPSGASRTVTTNSSGTFRAAGLRVGGPYTVTLDGAGSYASEAFENIFLQLAQTYPLNITPGARAVDEIIVTARAITSGTQLGASRTFDSANINAQANVGRDFKNIIRQDPRVSLDRTNGNAISIAGVNNRYNNLTIDGSRQNDDFGLNNSGFPTQRAPISIDAIDQVNVEIAPFDVTFGGFTGGTVNAVTKSGTNDFDGSIYWFYSNDSLTGDKIQGEDIELGDFGEKTYGGTLSGPIIPDRLWFFVNYEKFTSTDTDAIDFGPAGSGRANVVDNVTQADIDRVIAISNSVYGFDPLSLPESGSPVVDEKIFAKLDFQITDDHRLSASYQHVTGNDLNTQNNFTFGGGSLGLPSNWYDRSEKMDAVTAQLFSNWTDAFSTEVKVAWQDRDTGQNPLNGTDFAEMTIETPDGGDIVIGPDVFRHANFLFNEQLLIKVKGDYLLGDHVLSFGYERENKDTFNIFLPRSEGEYQFDSIEDFENRIASDFRYSNAVTGNKLDGGAGNATTINTVYLQDSWDAMPDLTLLFGARYDWYTSSDTPNENASFAARNGFSNQETLDGRGSFQPRFGFNYQFDERTTVRGGVGIFSGGSPTVWISNSFSNDGVTVVGPDDAGDFDVACTDITESPTALENVDGFEIPAAIDACLFPGAGNVNALDPDFKIPSILKYNLAIERDFNLGPLGDNWFISLEAIFSRDRNAPEWIELRRTQIGTAPDGRPVYDRPSAYDLLLTNSGGGKSDSYSITAQKTWETENAGIFNFYSSYTYTDVTDFNPAQSSTASSNFGRPATFDRNNRVLARSDFELKHRFNGTFSWQKAFWGENNSTVSFFFESRTGKPFSRTMVERPFDEAVFGGDRDFARRDSQLLFVPNSGDSSVIFADNADGLLDDGSVGNNAAVQSEFDNFLAQTGLDAFRGEILPRNLETSKWRTRVDMRFIQEVSIGSLPLVGESKFELFFDFENLTNFLDNDWGRVEQVSFPFNSPTVDVSHPLATDPETGLPFVGEREGERDPSQFVYSNFDGEDAISPEDLFTLPSLWKIQVGVKFRF